MTSTVSENLTSGLRSCRAVSGTAARSSARTSFNEPLPARPIGVRTASTMTASGMDASLSDPGVALAGRVSPASHSQGPAAEDRGEVFPTKSVGIRYIPFPMRLDVHQHLWTEPLV